ncbi:MAG: hypothetical protein CMM46_01035 [Rhodospirillaceae bacterium]|nr:hypothetical protein [Rhodospirillaceae bacterium]
MGRNRGGHIHEVGVDAPVDLCDIGDHTFNQLESVERGAFGQARVPYGIEGIGPESFAGVTGLRLEGEHLGHRERLSAKL